MEKTKEIAEQASVEGKSVVPTVIGERRPTAVTKVKKEPELPKQVPETKRPPVKEPPKKRSYKRNDDSQRAMKEYMALLKKDTQKILTDNDELYQPASTISFSTVGTLDNKNSEESQSQQQNQNQENELPPLPFKSGDLLYASNEIHINSDVPIPVVAEIVSGAFKKLCFSAISSGMKSFCFYNSTDLKHRQAMNTR